MSKSRSRMRIRKKSRSKSKIKIRARRAGGGVGRRFALISPLGIPIFGWPREVVETETQRADWQSS